jgi:hypothetical protein
MQPRLRHALTRRSFTALEVQQRLYHFYIMRGVTPVVTMVISVL